MNRSRLVNRSRPMTQNKRRTLAVVFAHPSHRGADVRIVCFAMIVERLSERVFSSMDSLPSGAATSCIISKLNEQLLVCESDTMHAVTVAL